jgi:hypothetical protein
LHLAREVDAAAVQPDGAGRSEQQILRLETQIVGGRRSATDSQRGSKLLERLIPAPRARGRPMWRPCRGR